MHILEKVGTSQLTLRRVSDEGQGSVGAVAKTISRVSGRSRKIEYSVEDAHVVIQVKPLGGAEKVVIVWPEKTRSSHQEMIDLAEQTWSAFS